MSKNDYITKVVGLQEVTIKKWKKIRKMWEREFPK